VRCHVGAKRRAGRARLTRPVLGCYTLATDVACFPEARALCKVERKPLSYVFHSYTQKLIVAAAPVMQLVKHHFPVSSLAVFRSASSSTFSLRVKVSCVRASE
jgi:hypothetical protein